MTRAGIMLLVAATPLTAQRPWQQLTMPTAAEAAAEFRSPPPEYSASVTWGWDSMNREAIGRDLDVLKGLGYGAVTIEAGYGMPAPYLSPGWFELVRYAVQEAERRGMRVWIIDEGKYPSGFAGGKFSSERPDLRMQGLFIDKRIPVSPGETLELTLDSATVSAVAVNLADSSSLPVAIRAGALDWTAPAGRWEVWLARHDFRTSETRAVNNPTRGKDTTNSLFDYLNPAGTRQFLDFTHNQYKKYLGDQFGETVLGFRGDEPDFGHTPWTPGILEEFQERKGYDVTPYLASFFARWPTEEARRAKADYWDVWSDLFGKNFFGIQADWAAQNHVEYMVHLNHEDMAMQLVRSEGDFFRDMRRVEIPGVDAIWNQIWPDSAEADYPKLASSAAHLFGHPRAMSESFAAYNPRPTVAEAKWVINDELVHGINLFEFMFFSSSATGRGGPSGYMAEPDFPALNAYTRRASYLLSQGRPAADIAVYYPTSSMWLGDRAADRANLEIAQKLLSRQRDFDWVDDRTLASLLTLRDDTLTNLSGQSYRAVVVPSITAISAAALDKLHRFANAGGTVIFLGRTPSLRVERTFLDAGPVPDPDWAIVEPSGELTPRVLAALPTPDLALDRPAPEVRYLHRHLKDAEVYFVFNEGDEKVTRTVDLAGTGEIEAWDAASGRTSSVAGASAIDGGVRFPLELGPREAMFFVVAPGDHFVFAHFKGNGEDGQINGRWYVYFDKYTQHQYGVIVSDDLVHWTDESDRLTMPDGIRHGTAFRVLPQTAGTLRRFHGRTTAIGEDQ